MVDAAVWVMAWYCLPTPNPTKQAASDFRRTRSCGSYVRLYALCSA
jgi:hypothetical protein